MSEEKIAGEILEAIWKAEKIAIDFHGKRITKKQFIKCASEPLLELTGLIISLHLEK